MKRTLPVLIAALFLVTSADAQQERKNSKLMDLVVQIPLTDTNTTWIQLKDKMNGLANVSVEGYCPGQKLLYLRLDPKQYFNVLVAIDEAGFTYYVKKDINVIQGIEACEDKQSLYLRTSSSVESPF